MAEAADGPVDAALAAGAAGLVPANVALMRALVEARDPAAVDAALARCGARLADDAASRARLAAVDALWRAHPGAWALVRGVIAAADHWSGPDRSGPDGAEPGAPRWADVFDRLAAAAPDAASALYALGDPDLLGRATDAVVDRLHAWGLLGPDRDVVELGCGSGRFLEALAPRVRTVLGLDVSDRMVEAARRRCAALGNVGVERSGGRDLAVIADASADLLLGADVFPYLHGGGDALVASHMGEAARVLRAGGHLLVLNWSYRGDLDRDRRDALLLAAAHGLAVRRFAAGDFALWDAATFHFTKPAPPP